MENYYDDDELNIYEWFLLKKQDLSSIKCDIHLNCQKIQRKIVSNQLSIPLVASAWRLKRQNSF
jgi:hypothetical protein